MEPLDPRDRALVRIQGDLDIGPPNAHAHFAALEITRDEADAAGVHMRLDGTLGEIRKLRFVSEEYADVIAHAATGPDDARGSLTLRALPALAREIATDADKPAAFDLTRYAPESVSRRSAEWAL